MTCEKLGNVKHLNIIGFTFLLEYAACLVSQKCFVNVQE
jgi:hypothetical protein